MFQGAGLLGIYGCAILKEAGYGKVYVSDIIEARLEQAAKFGAIPINGGNLFSGIIIVAYSISYLNSEMINFKIFRITPFIVAKNEKNLLKDNTMFAVVEVRTLNIT